jgi:hypothetical protein
MELGRVKSKRPSSGYTPAEVYELECANWSTALAGLTTGRETISERARRSARALAEQLTRQQVGQSSWDRYQASKAAAAKLPTGPVVATTRSQKRAEAAMRDGERSPGLAHYVLAPVAVRSSQLST